MKKQIIKKQITKIRKHEKTLIVITVFCLLAAGMFARDYLSEEENSAGVTRQEEGSGGQSQTFFYRIDGGEEQEITLEIGALERSGEAAEDLLLQAAEEWEEQFLGENKSENEICEPLSLPKQLCDGLVTVSYESSDYSILDSDGTIYQQDITEDGVLVELTAEFTYAGYSRRESRWLNVILPPEDSPDRIALQLQKKLFEIEENTRQNQTFLLPTDVEGHKILWKSQKEPQWMYFLLLGVVSALCLELRMREEKRKNQKKREDCLIFEYPQMVEQVSLLLGSGMTIRSAWERILLTDQKMRRETRQKMRLFIEEMWITYREISKGCGEREAYERFGARIGLIPYRRFAGILSQNLSKGTRDVQKLLQEEAREALEMRKNHARRLGEEAGTKLLFPMLLMFGLILLVLLMPAVQNF